MKNKEKKKNYLSDKIVEIISSQTKGKVLDLGCGDGRTGKNLLERGFQIEAFDMDHKRFEFKDAIPFKKGTLNNALPYESGSFDYAIFMEVIEHIYNPDFVISEISRILRSGGQLILSTPNILNISSRFRYLFEGSFDFFREPILDYSRIFPTEIQNLHVLPWKYQELEYLLYKNGLQVKDIFTDFKKRNFLLLALILKPMIMLANKAKEGRSKKKGGVGFFRIHKILRSDELLLGRHLILQATKK